VLNLTMPLIIRMVLTSPLGLRWHLFFSGSSSGLGAPLAISSSDRACPAVLGFRGLTTGLGLNLLQATSSYEIPL